LSSNKKIMGEHKSGKLSKALLWITFGGMATAVICLFVLVAKQIT